MDNRSISLPESSFELEQGFLAGLWKERQEAASMGRAELFIQFVRRGFEMVVQLPLTNALTCLTIAASLFVFGWLLLVLHNVESILTSAGGLRQFTLYLEGDTEQNQIDRLLKELKEDRSIGRLRYISKEQALEELGRELGDDDLLLKGFSEANPLPPAISVQYYPDELGLRPLDGKAEQLAALPHVTHVDRGSEWVERISTVLKIVRYFGGLALTVFAAIIVFIMANTIELVLHARRSEVQIMQLVGARISHIQLPFIVSAISQGVVGVSLAFFMLKISFVLVVRELSGFQLFGLVFPEPTFLGTWGLGAILLLGLGVSVAGSFVALARFLRS